MTARKPRSTADAVLPDPPAGPAGRDAGADPGPEAGARTASAIARGIGLSGLGAGAFVRRVLIIGGLLLLALVAWRLSIVFLLLFAAVLLALVLRASADALQRRTGIPPTWGVMLVLVVALAALAAVLWLFGSQLAAQFDVLAERLPQGAQQLRDALQQHPWGRYLLGHLQSLRLGDATGRIASLLALAVASAANLLAFGAVVLFAGIYLAVDPPLYRDGLLRLVPAQHRARALEIADLAAQTLRQWLLAQAASMAVIGLLTAFGLWVCGIGAPLALGLIAALFAFIPYMGPLMSAAPGLLMAATQGGNAVWAAAAVFVAVQFIEGNIVTPLMQARLAQLPPVLSVFAAVVFGVLLGPLGVLLAAPLTVLLLVLVQTLYIEGVLHEPRSWPDQS